LRVKEIFGVVSEAVESSLGCRFYFLRICSGGSEWIDHPWFYNLSQHKWAKYSWKGESLG